MTQRSLLVRILTTVSLAGAAFPALSDTQITHIPFTQAPPGSVGLGAGRRFGESPYKYVDTVSSIENEKVSDLVPLYLYEGNYLFSRGTQFGVHLLKAPFSIDLISQYRFDRLETESSPFYEGINERRQTFESGLAVSFSPLDDGELGLSWVYDTLDRHQGQEASLNYKHRFSLGRWNISPFAAAIYQNENFIDYYYGVDESEAREDIPVYSGTDAFIYRAGLNTDIQVFNNWTIFLNGSIEALDDVIYQSPLVDKDSLLKLYLGFTYNFGSTLKPQIHETKKDSANLWSWRLHSGYTAEETFHKVHRAHIQGSEDVDTYLAGVTLGRLLKAGERAEFWLKGSVNRRLENGLQDNFNEYNLYVMSMGHGYKGWDGAELFRYGFGFGFSYADKIPIIEQVKQAKRDGNTSHFLNYLEAQFDVPLRLFSESKSVSDCYVGVSIIHRSGIFASSDILGNVSGGSDVLAGHIECKR